LLFVCLLSFVCADAGLVYLSPNPASHFIAMPNSFIRLAVELRAEILYQFFSDW